MSTERQPSPLGQALGALEDLLPRLDRLAQLVESSLEQSTTAVALMRGKLNNTLWAGTINLQGTAGGWSWGWDSTVDFAGIMYSDAGGFGPFVISTDATGASTGAGTFTTFGSDAGLVPIVGRHLSITCPYSGAGTPRLFVAAFTSIQEPFVNP